MTGRPASRWHDPESLALRATAERFYEKEFLPHVREFEEHRCVSRDLWRKAGEQGLLCCSIPEEYGGGGGTFAHDLAVVEAGGWIPEVVWGIAVHSATVAHYILTYGTEEQRQRWLPPLASGEMVAAIAMTEPSTGSDLRAIKTRAQRDGSSYVVTGSKTFISNGSQADLVLVAARTGTGGHAGDISLIAVETADAPGFARGRNLRKIGQHAFDTAELFFEGVRVGTENLLGVAEGCGFEQLKSQLVQERLTIGLEAVAAMETAVNETVRYTKDREIFGKPSFEHQNTRFALAEAATRATIGREFVDHCIELHLAGQLDPATAAMCKWWLTDTQGTVIDRCLQLFGGYGYMSEYAIARLYADARVQRIYAGANEVMKEIVARSL